jgi:ABC-2 type transport system ATP-binding protein
MATIEIDGLTKQFGPVTAVDHLNFTADTGQVIGFLGPNGAGKTTTLRMLLGLVTPSAGTATIDGRAYRDLDHPLRHVGAMLEASSFHPGRRGIDHLRLQARATGIGHARVAEIVGMVGLDAAAARRVGGYSLGMRQRLGLGLALLADPELLILDEPANGLDPEGVRWLRELLHGLAREGRSVLVSSHVLAEVAQTVDRVGIVDRGRLVKDAPLAEVTGGGVEAVMVRSPNPDALIVALAGAGINAQAADDGWVRVSGAGTEQVGRRAAEAGVPIFETRTETTSLEDIFLALTDHHHSQETQR